MSAAFADTAAVFVDTSAILALLSADDAHHRAAKRAFEALAGEEAGLVTTSYVLVETYALLGRRFGRDAGRRFREEFAPLLGIVWVDEDLHEAGLDLLSSSQARDVSLVDAVSFAAMRGRRMERAFAYDKHFAKAGFTTLK
jgi:uncharacterized protein